MADTPNSSTGISILRNRERNIPDVEVTMLPTATMLDGISYTGKDLMSQVWSEENIVYNVENQIQQNFTRGTTYSRQLSFPSTAAPGQNHKLYGVSTSQGLTQSGGYDLPSLVYLANGMILNPYMVPVNTYLTKRTTYTVTSADLDNYGQKVIVKGSADNKEPGTDPTSTPAVSTDSGSVSFDASFSNRSNGTYQETKKDSQGNATSTPNYLLGVNRVQTRPPANPAVTDFFTSMSSTFFLNKNQPFGICVSMDSPSATWLSAFTQQEASLFGTGGNQGSVDPIYQIAPSLRKNTVTFIEFGGGDGDQLMLVLYQQRGKIECYKLNTQNVQTTSTTPATTGIVPGNNNNAAQQQSQPVSTKNVRTRTKVGDRDIKSSADSDTGSFLKLNLAIYPIGNQLVVCDGEDGLRVGVKSARHDTVAIFNFENTLNISQGPVKITTYLGSATYVYSHVLHVSKGIFASPVVNIEKTGAIGEPIVSVDFEGRVGAGQVKGEEIFTFPQGKDTFYDFLGDSTIATESLIDDGLGYKLTLQSNVNDEGNEFKRIYSPRVYSVQARVRPQTITVGMNPPVIDKKDIIRVEVRQTCLGASASVTLNNRNLSTCPPTAGGKYNIASFSGVKPIEIKYAVTGSRLQKRFTGYVVERAFSLGSKGTKSDITLTCEDVSIKAKNSFAVNLPLFDGWCHLAAFYYLAKEAGYSDDEIVYDRDGNVKLTSILQGDITNMTGGCFAGHEGTPFLGQVIHAPLPLPNDKFSPFYMFPMGTSIWNCMNEIRKFSGFYLFANESGQLVYAPPENVFSSGNLTTGTGETSKFVEQGGQAINNNQLRFTEVQGQLNVTHRPINSKNELLVVGYDTRAIDSTDGVGAPLFQVVRQDGWPNNTTSPNYIPWKAITILRNPMWNDSARVAFIAAETFKRINRPYIFVSWSSFGQTGIFPYNIVTIDETLSAETGVVGNSIVVTSITDRIDANNMSFFSSYEGEIVNPPSLTDVSYSGHHQGYTVE